MRERIGFLHRDTAGSFLLAALVLLIVVLPLIAGGDHSALPVRLALAITMVLSVVLLTGARWVAGLFFALALLHEGLRLPDPPLLGAAGADLVIAAELAVVGFVVLRHVTLVQTVTTDTVMSAISGFLLLALLWTMLYAAIETAWPGSYRVHGEPIANHAADEVVFLYYSLVTITTLGYGDILPASPGAALLAGMEAVTGQLYVAILIARIVSLGMRQTEA